MADDRHFAYLRIVGVIGGLKERLKKRENYR